MPQLVIHLGDFKTGTTSVQNVLMQEQYQSAQSILYPTKNNHTWLAKAIQNGFSDFLMAQHAARIYRKIRTTQADIVILSAEHFQVLRPIELKRWLHAALPEYAADARFVCYVRPHAAFILSTYAEQIKLGVTRKSFPEFLEKFIAHRTMQYARRFSSWRKVLGDQFVLRAAVPEALRNGDVVEDFFHTVLGEGAFSLTQSTTANRSLSRQDLEFLRQVHSHIVAQGPRLKAPKRNRLGNEIQAALAFDTPQDHSRLMYSAEQMQQVQSAFEKDAATMDKRFFDTALMTQALSGAAHLVADQAPCSKEPSPRQLHALQQVAPKIYHSFLQDPKQGHY